MAYSVHIASFEGPLDLLLQLVESQQMDITSVSLIEVTDPFLKHLEAHRGKIPTEELADFLVVASKLVYLKSKALLPSLYDAELEEGPDLETQLRMYKAFVDAARRIDEMVRAGNVCYNREPRTLRQTVAAYVAPEGVTSPLLETLYRAVIRRLEPIAYLPKAAVERTVTIEEKIHELSNRIKQAMRVSFKRFLSESQDRTEMVVSFLALLELIKQRIVRVEQQDLFDDIHLSSSSSSL